MGLHPTEHKDVAESREGVRRPAGASPVRPPARATGSDCVPRTRRRQLRFPHHASSSRPTRPPSRKGDHPVQSLRPSLAASARSNAERRRDPLDHVPKAYILVGHEARQTQTRPRLRPAGRVGSARRCCHRALQSQTACETLVPFRTKVQNSDNQLGPPPPRLDPARQACPFQTSREAGNPYDSCGPGREKHPRIPRAFISPPAVLATRWEACFRASEQLGD